MNNPPRLALALLRLACRSEKRAEVRGDLLEAFSGWADAHGVAKARRRVWHEVLVLLLWRMVGWCRGIHPRSTADARPLREAASMTPSSRGRGQRFSDAGQDLAYAVRRLLKSPGATAVAILILACGVGGNTTIFTLADALFLEPPPLISHPEELVRLDAAVAEFGYYDFEYYRENGTAFQDILAYGGFPGTRGRNPRNGGEVAVGHDDDRVQATAWVVSNNYFSLLGIPLLNGYGFTGVEGQPQSDNPEVVISYGFWRRQFGSDPSIAERPLYLNGVPFRVVGVAPSEFRGVNPTHQVPDLFLPIMAAGAISRGFDEALKRFSESGEPRASRFLQLVARLRPGLTVETAAAEMQLLQERWNAEFTDWAETVYGQGYQVTIRSQFQMTPGEARRFRQMLTFLWFVVGSVFLIACTNLALLLFARAAGREREMGIRAVLGAGRGRLLRQLFTESLILAAAGGALGVLIAYAGTGAAASTLPWSIAFDLSPDSTVIVFAVIVAGLAALLFGTAPAWVLSNVNVLEALQRPGQGRARAVFRGGLVAGQTALSLVLLVVGGLFARSLQQASNVDLGFEQEHRLLMSLQLGNHGYSEERGLQFTDRVLERLKSIPGVEAVTAACRMPFRPRMSWTFAVPGTAYAEDGLFAGLNIVAPDYLEVMEIPLLAGRTIDSRDQQGTQRVVVVNRTFSDQMWPGESPLGKRLPAFDSTEWTVVGLAETSVYWNLGENPIPFVYFPIRQLYTGRMTFHLATGPDPMTVAPAVERAMREFEPNVAVAAGTVDGLLDEQLASFRIWATFIAIFSTIALFLAMVGLYGVQSSLVARRTREIGIRMALGAKAATVVGAVVASSLLMGGVGALVGIGVALGFGGLVRSFLFDVTPQDPLVFFAVTVLLLGACFAAGLLPALKASRVNPVEALAQE